MRVESYACAMDYLDEAEDAIGALLFVLESIPASGEDPRDCFLREAGRVMAHRLDRLREARKLFASSDGMALEVDEV